jgi:DNA polymerase-3 subunit delta
MENPQNEIHPTIYLLRGDDNLAMTQFVEALFAKLGDPGMADLNTTRLDGRTASDEDLRTAATSMPFLTDRRLVILGHPLTKLNSENARTRFLDLLSKLPDTTALVLLVEDNIKWDSYARAEVWQSLKDSHWLMKWVHKQPKERILIRDCLLPNLSQMPKWIMDKARKLEGQFTLDGAQALAGLLENDTQLAEIEIEKLLVYVDRRRPVDEQDVIALTASSATVSVFDMVDSLTEGNGRSAIRLLHKLLETEEPMIIFAMIIRQYRLLIQAREMLDNGQPVDQVIRELGFGGKKAVAQARRYSIQQLEALYHRLLSFDEAIKTGQMPVDLMLDTLVAEFTH